MWGRCLLVAHVLLLRVELEEIPLHLLLRLDALLVHLRPRERPVTFVSVPLICCQWTYSSTNMLSSFADGGPQRAQLRREGCGARGVCLE